MKSKQIFISIIAVFSVLSADSAFSRGRSSGGGRSHGYSHSYSHTQSYPSYSKSSTYSSKPKKSKVNLSPIITTVSTKRNNKQPASTTYTNQSQQTQPITQPQQAPSAPVPAPQNVVDTCNLLPPGQSCQKN